MQDVDFECVWGGRINAAFNFLPLLGKTKEGVWYCTAFAGHGLVTTTLGGYVQIVLEILMFSKKEICSYIDLYILASDITFLLLPAEILLLKRLPPVMRVVSDIKHFLETFRLAMLVGRSSS